MLASQWLSNSNNQSQARQQFSVGVFFLQVWVVFSDAEETSGTAALAQVHLSSQNFQTQQNLSRLVCSCVCMFVTSVCAYLRVGGERSGVLHR